MYRTRKEKLEKVCARGRALSDSQAAAAWKDLMVTVGELSAHEFPRTPKFRDLLTGLVAAYARAERSIVRGDEAHIPHNVTLISGYRSALNVTTIQDRSSLKSNP